MKLQVTFELNIDAERAKLDEKMLLHVLKNNMETMMESGPIVVTALGSELGIKQATLINFVQVVD